MVEVYLLLLHLIRKEGLRHWLQMERSAVRLLYRLALLVASIAGCFPID